MIHFAFDSPAWLCLLALAPAVLVLAARTESWRSRTLTKLADNQTLGYLLSELDPRRRRLKTILISATCGLAVLALCRPSWDRTAPEVSKGRDILVLLDVSRSMYAADVAPSRLDAARRGLAGFTDRLRGDRIGLVAFAGNPALRCPLTSDYDFFRAAVEGASPDSVSLGGTEIGKAIRFALKDGFDDLSQRSKHLLLVTDAEDHGYAASAAAAEAAHKDIRLAVVGLGDSNRGARVPVDGPGPLRYVIYQGQEVWSKLNETAIRNLAGAGGGNALVIGPDSNQDLGDAFDRLVTGTRGKAVLPRVQGYWIPLSLALACLAVELALSERRVH
jgi:Ca-activated chloride channel family protein